jgi:hypothetical protein
MIDTEAVPKARLPLKAAWHEDANFTGGDTLEGLALSAKMTAYDRLVYKSPPLEGRIGNFEGWARACQLRQHADQPDSPGRSIIATNKFAWTSRRSRH